MHAINANWTQGRIVPSEPIDSPAGSELAVEPIAITDHKMGLTEEEWKNYGRAMSHDPTLLARHGDRTRCSGRPRRRAESSDCPSENGASHRHLCACSRGTLVRRRM